jgi:geranylgeranylglycerol-phosphate geranylgeranyltransferase
MNFKSYFKLIRPINFIITFITGIVAVVLADRNGMLNPAIYFLTGLAAALTAAAGNVINDIYDIEIDRINRPGRPLPSGEVPVPVANAFYIFLIFSSLITAFYINISAVFMVAVVSMALTLYASRLKRLPFIANIIVAFITGLVFVFGGIAANNINNAYIPAAFAFLINLVRELLKDIEDIKGDQAAGIRTLPIVAGIKGSVRIISFLTVILVLFTLYPFIIHYYSIEYIVIVMVTVNPLMIYFLKSLRKNHSQENLKRLSLLLKINMLFGLASIYFGR